MISILKSLIFEIKNIRIKLLKNINIEKGVKVLRYAHVKEIRANIVIEKKTVIDKGCHICAVEGGKIYIGKEVYFNKNCIVVCRNNIYIGDRCMFGPNVCIYDHDHRFGTQGVSNSFNVSPIIIDEGSWIGAGCIILRGTHIGKNCVIGAGIVLKGYIPDNSIVKRNTNEYIVEKIK